MRAIGSTPNLSKTPPPLCALFSQDVLIGEIAHTCATCSYAGF